MKPATTLIFMGLIGVGFISSFFDKPDKHKAFREKKETPAQIQAKKQKDEQCMLDPECFGKNHLSLDSQVECQMSVEAKAKYQYKWTDSWTQPKFIVYQWKTANKAVLTIAGGSLEFQNQFSAWQKTGYQCDILLSTGRVIDVQLYPLHG
jgi:hypothetical protein